MGIQQHHPDPAAEPPAAEQAMGDSAGLPGLMEQLTRALLHTPAEQADPVEQADPAERADLSAPAVDADVPVDLPVGTEQAEPVAETATPEPVAEVKPPTPRRPGAVLGELAFLDE